MLLLNYTAPELTGTVILALSLRYLCEKNNNGHQKQIIIYICMRINTEHDVANSRMWLTTRALKRFQKPTGTFNTHESF